MIDFDSSQLLLMLKFLILFTSHLFDCHRGNQQHLKSHLVASGGFICKICFEMIFSPGICCWVRLLLDCLFQDALVLNG